MAGMARMADLLSSLDGRIVAFSVLLAIVLYFIGGSVVNYRRLRGFKGPPLAAFSRFWIFWEEINGRLPESQFAALKKYGSPCRIGPDLLVTDDAELVRHMAAPGTKWTRSGWYDAMRFDPRLDTVFSTRNDRLHTELKAKEHAGYNGRDIPTLEPEIDKYVLELLSLIKNTYAGKQMDFAPVARYFTLDILSAVAWGRSFGFLAANRDLWNYQKTSEGFVLLLGLAANHKFIRAILYSPLMQAIAAPKPTDKAGIGAALGFGCRAVAERYGPNAKVKKDILGSFVEKGLSQTQCEGEAFLQIIAGSDSTTTVFRSTIFLLAGNASAYAKLRAEIDNAVNAGEISSPVVKYKEASKLSYLGACIWEGVRLFPPLFGLKEKTSPLTGEEVNGVYYPPGTGVAICDDALCQNVEVFGQDSELYRPERFLEGDEATRTRRMRTVEVIFGAGKYQCLGRMIAMMELHKGIVELMRHFDIAIANPMVGVRTIRHNIHIQSQMNMVFRERQ